MPISTPAAFLSALLLAASAAVPAAATTYFDTPFTEYAEGVSVLADPASAITPLGALTVSITDMGLGCIDGRYCGPGSISIHPQAGGLRFDQSGYVVHSFGGWVTRADYAPESIALHVLLDTPYTGYSYLGGDSFLRYAFSGVDIVLGRLTGFRSDPAATTAGEPDLGDAGNAYLSLVGTVPVPAAGGLLGGALLALLALGRGRRARG